ncbi:hypothetical protein EVC08_059 [Rhizobium phage RHph_N65]|nr:hypothetical protein EVC08_059 [Rhizobium phage RHph_N65]
MTYPSKPIITYSYTGFQAAQGGNAFPGTQMDADIASLKTAASTMVDFVKLFANSDGTAGIVISATGGFGGSGAPGPFGGSGFGVAVVGTGQNNGNAAAAPGAGGGGGLANSGSSGTGGAGAAGAVIIEY